MAPHKVQRHPLPAQQTRREPVVPAGYGVGLRGQRADAGHQPVGQVRSSASAPSTVWCRCSAWPASPPGKVRDARSGTAHRTPRRAGPAGGPRPGSWSPITAGSMTQPHCTGHSTSAPTESSGRPAAVTRTRGERQWRSRAGGHPAGGAQPLTRSALFLVATIDPAGESRVRALLPDLSGLARAVRFRAPGVLVPICRVCILIVTASGCRCVPGIGRRRVGCRAAPCRRRP